MTAVGIPANAKQLAALVKEGEGPALEFKRSTGELKEGMRTLCAFLNGSGGMVLFGVRPEGAIEGQTVSDQTLRDVAQTADRFEPPADVSIHRIKLKEIFDAVVPEKEDNILKWAFSVPARSEKALEYGFSITYPDDMTLSFGGR